MDALGSVATSPLSTRQQSRSVHENFDNSKDSGEQRRATPPKRKEHHRIVQMAESESVAVSVDSSEEDDESDEESKSPVNKVKGESVLV
jgi:hypothetical protein